MAKKRTVFSEKVSIIAMALGLFMPTLVYCLSQSTEDYLYSHNPYALIVKPTKDHLAPNNSFDSVFDHREKGDIAITKLLWIAYVLDNQTQMLRSNLQIKATENNVAPPENLKLFLVSHYLNRCSDLLL